MIVTEFFKEREDGVKLYRTYSDANMMILQNETGIKYAEAIDIENSGYTYSETDEPIEELNEENIMQEEE
jgi:hypothetical protein